AGWSDRGRSARHCELGRRGGAAAIESCTPAARLHFAWLWPYVWRRVRAAPWRRGNFAARRRRIRERRIMLGLTQQRLAEMIGVTYQQAHKYERGINRVSAGRLFEIARALSAPITYFYEGIREERPRQITPQQRMQLEIARSFAEIRNEKHQEAV